MKTIFSLLTVFILIASQPLALAQVTDAQPAKSERKYPSEFIFEGRDLLEFVRAIEAQFGVDLNQIRTIPQSMLITVNVPKMRVGGPGQKLDFRNVLNLYNQISAEGDPALGRWVVKGPLDRDPEVVMLVPTARRRRLPSPLRRLRFPQRVSRSSMNCYKRSGRLWRRKKPNSKWR